MQSGGYAAPAVPPCATVDASLLQWACTPRMYPDTRDKQLLTQGLRLPLQRLPNNVYRDKQGHMHVAAAANGFGTLQLMHMHII
jgi:hypothetical protein